MQIPRHILPTIVIAQFCCTSLWFAGNSIIEDLIASFDLSSDALAHLTSSVQFGFILGTLVFALLSIADRYSPSKVFLVCSIAGSLFNAAMIIGSHTILSLFAVRFVTGFFLAGIYPVGMKIAADYYNTGLGKSLGLLVGALVLGTAFPHLLRTLGTDIDWHWIIIATSALAIAGGLMIYCFVPDGPNRRAASQVDFSAIGMVFRNRPFRSAAFGYFGHMWELYAFWAFAPLLLTTYSEQMDTSINVPLWSFIIIGIGAISCAIGGYVSESIGARKVAVSALITSGICCLLIPFVFGLSKVLFLSIMIIWGIAVIMDSPMLSTLVAQNADPQIKGTALTIVNSIGFSITIVSIQLINYLNNLGWDISYIVMLLAIGPVFGVINLRSVN